MDDHAGRLVHDEQGLVLVDDADRDVLAGNRPLLELRYLDSHDISGLGAIARLLALAVHEHIPLSNERCCLRPRELRALGDKQVEADIAVRLDGELS